MAVKKGKEEAKKVDKKAVAKKNESKAKSKVKEEVVETQVEEVEEDTPKKMPKRPKGYTKFQWTATQMNFIMKLNPAIEVESEEKDIINDIEDTATDQILSTDPFDKEAWEVFEELGITPITKEEETAEEEDTPKKKAKAEKKEKGEKVARFRSSLSPEDREKRKKFLESLIAKGNMTKKDIINKCLEKFPDWNKGGLSTTVSDSKNPKYNKLSNLVIEKEGGILRFK